MEFKHILAIEPLWQRSCQDYPGWNMAITDQQRVDVFLKELAAAEKKGDWANLVFLYLPQDHTSGTTPGMPTPQAHMADNDLALGRAVEAISKSKFWPKTAIFVVEDDPQNGWDHVDGHRSICLVDLALCEAKGSHLEVLQPDLCGSHHGADSRSAADEPDGRDWPR